VDSKYYTRERIIKKGDRRMLNISNHTTADNWIGYPIALKNPAFNSYLSPQDDINA
jgi:hypothetical protein